MGKQESRDCAQSSQDELKIPVSYLVAKPATAIAYVNQLGDNDGEIVESDDGGLINRGENDGGLLTNEELDVGDDLVEDDRDGAKNGRDLVNGQVIGTETLCRINPSATKILWGYYMEYERSWPVRGVRDVVASAKI